MPRWVVTISIRASAPFFRFLNFRSVHPPCVSSLIASCDILASAEPTVWRVGVVDWTVLLWQFRVRALSLYSSFAARLLVMVFFFGWAMLSVGTFPCRLLRDFLASWCDIS
jgi:hypothetical protein